MTLTTLTIGGNDYVAYATVAEADAYLAVDPTRGPAWAQLTEDQKASNLVAATRRLDLLEYSGTKADPAQENQWPRENATCNGDPVSSSGVPVELQNATILKAGSITLDASQSNAGGSGSNIRSVQAGSAQVEFFRPTIPGLGLQDETVFSLVRCLLAGSSAAGAVGFGVASGTTGESIFEDPDYPALDEGFA